MSDAKKPYLLRINSLILEAVERWAEDELRSTNAQIEYLLRQALQRAGRVPKPGFGNVDNG